MKQLIIGTTAYEMFSNDATAGRLSHAYMLYFNDSKNLRGVLKLFALRFFGLTENDNDGKRLLNETLTDCLIYPSESKKLTAEAVSRLISDSALKPFERDKKLYIISGFEQASALLQNKLLKTLEEPPEGVYFLLGVTSLAPVLDTVKSRVKTLTIPPFTKEAILGALKRRGENPLNAAAAENCGGIFGTAENMVGGGWFGEVVSAAREIFNTDKLSEAGTVAIKYGDIKFKTELLLQLKSEYANALCRQVNGESSIWQTATLMYALESVDKAASDVKVNAYFQGLLYDLMLRVIEENDKWLKLRA